MKKRILSILIDVLIIISSSLGIYLTFSHGNFMSSSALLYYTIQSNIIIILVCLIFVIYKLLNKKILEYLYVIKFISVVGITITFLVFTFMLVPQMFGGYNSYLLSLGNLTVHLISPVLSVVSFIFFDEMKRKKITALYGITMPLTYCIFIFILTSIKSEPMFKGFNNATRFPYFFMNYETNGWFTITSNIWEIGFVYWFIIIFIITILIGKLYLKFLKSN